MKKKLLPLSLVTLALASCGGTTSTQTVVSYGKYPVADIQLKQEVVDPAEYTDAHLKKSAQLYNENYGKFYSNYVTNVAGAKNISERYAYQAIAEGKLLSNGTLLPGTANGGNYAITRVVPKSITPCLWGSDSYRYHNALVKTGDVFTNAQRDELLAIYKAVSDDASIEPKDKQKTYETLVKSWFTDKGFQLNRTYTQYYDGDPTVYDILNSYYAADSEPLVNTFDGLVEYDDFNNIQPALATSWNYDETTYTYTFTIRKNVKWVNREGTDQADVKASDFVHGFQHMLDCAAGLEYLVDGLVEGVREYLEQGQKAKDFSVVGVTADDEANTVSYKLTGEVPYFLTMLGYSIFAPLCDTYYQSKGGKYGSDFDPSASDYKYATDYSSIAYCGPYIVKTFTAQNTFEFEKNAKYWNVDNINIDSIIWLENDGSDTLKAYNGAKSGEVVGTGFNTNAITKAKADGIFATSAYVSTVDANSYPFYINLNRSAYANYNDKTVAVSAKTDAQKTVAEAAFKNVNVRLALCFAMDRVAYYAQSKGLELAANAMTNSYTPGNFVKTEEEVTVNINNRKVTFPAGTYYGEIMQAQIDADGLPMKVWNPSAEGGIGSGFGFDGWHNPDAAVAYFNKGIEQLKANGVEISESKPLVIDLTTVSSNSVTDNQIKALGQSIKNALGNLIQINYVDCVNRANALKAEYYPDKGYDTNCDIMTISGWGPDYGDPATYLDTFLPQSGGMLKCSGIF